LKINLKKLLPCLLIPLAVGALAGWITAGAMDRFALLQKPPLSPPAWLFPVVWTVLYLLMGFSLYLVLQMALSRMARTAALRIWGVQLAANFLWPILFFSLGIYGFAFFWLILLWLLVLRMIVLFRRLRPIAGTLQLPYLLWLTFAAYLNLGIWILN